MHPRIPEVTLLEELGRGEGGIVYRALHRGVRCAVKLPKQRNGQPAPANANGGSFEQELLLLARLARAGLPHVVQVATTAETSYAILEEPRGEPLAKVLASPVAEADAVRVAVTLASSLQELHQAGFVHGALTLDSILVADGGAKVSLIDNGSVARPSVFDARADIHAVGVVLRECAKRIELRATARSTLIRVAEELAFGSRLDLGWAIGELEPYSETGTRRGTSFPPPSCESLSVLTGPIPGAARRARSELAQLQRSWDYALQYGGRIIELLGPAGSGKTRLLSAFAEAIGKDNVQVLSVKCRDSDWEPFSALKRLLDGHLAGLSLLEPERRSQVEASLRAAAGPMSSRVRLLSPRLAEVFKEGGASLPEGDAQQVFVAGMADFLAKYLESSGPSALVIDDIHWLDASSRMVLSRLAGRLCPQRHLLVYGARSDDDSREPLERFRSMLVPEFIETVQLGPLSDRDSAGVIAEYLGMERPPARDLVEQLSQLSDGTPLSLLGLLQLTLERGHLRPIRGSWRLDGTSVQRMRLPASSQALIDRRLSLLTGSTLHVLQAAAITRTRFDFGLLAAVTGMERKRVRIALDDAVSARLLEVDSRGALTFVHDSVWEALLRGVQPEARRELHQAVAEAFDAEGGYGTEYEYELARHYAAGLIERDPERAFDVTWQAARRAIEACDDVLALSFLKPAEAASRLTSSSPSRQFFVDLAESHLRTGGASESLRCFQLALERSPRGFERAYVRGRMAWVYHYDSNADACWSALQAALDECSRSVPADHSLSLLLSAVRWGSKFVRKVRGQLAVDDAQTLCSLYNLCARVSFESGHPKRGIASILQMALVARELPPCRTVVHADLMLAFMFAVAGAERPFRRLYARAEAMASSLGDPIAQTLCLQMLHVSEAWRGDMDASEGVGRACVVERGHWMELGELCHVCLGMYSLEVGRGRPEHALHWIELALERVRQTERAPAVFALLEDAAVSTLIALGREHEVAAFKRRLQFVQRAEIQRGDSYFHVLSFQSRVARLTERGDLGEEFETLVADFNRLEQDPGKAPPLAMIYYMHVAHARLHQCLRAEASGRPALLRKLSRALDDLTAATARVEGARAHAVIVHAAYCWLSGKTAEAESLLVAAEQTGRGLQGAWILFTAARLRAHMLRAGGKLEAARAQARIAEYVARENSQLNNARIIQEEFELVETSVGQPRSEVAAPYMRRHLDALLRISQANSRELGPERQTRLILDELVETLHAERAFLFMRNESAAGLSLRASRIKGGGDLESDASYDRALVEQVYATGQAQLTAPTHAWSGGPRSDRACIVVALVLREQSVGVLYIDRPDLSGEFHAEDAALLQALANQVPIALELAGALRERERLEQNLRQSHKMEAIGRLAGGIAHDFNNILGAIQMAAHSLSTILPNGYDVQEDIRDIQDSARRGAELTRQLLTFSRGKPVLPRRIVLGDLVRELTPMLNRIVRAEVTLEVHVAPQTLATMADPSQLERVLMNLCQNASDAMPNGGMITIRVGRPGSADAGMTPPGLKQGTSYAVLTVSDTGSGMSEQVRARLFEPFFTTKTGQRGTGLGLANVYAIVQQCGGVIDVASEPGAGSTFRIYLPRCESASEPVLPTLRIPPPAPVPAREELGGETVLVVDDDDMLRREVVNVLERAGYQVLSARDGEDALRTVESFDGLLDLAVTDLRMPGMDGSDLAVALLDRDPDLRVLFVSGDGPQELERKGMLTAQSAFLAKPFGADALIAQVRSILRSQTRVGSLVAVDERLS